MNNNRCGSAVEYRTLADPVDSKSEVLFSIALTVLEI